MPPRPAVYRETHAAAGMIPVNVLSEPALAVSEGHRPAHSRPADPTREYEPGSGASHDPAPVHRPHPPRAPPADRRRRGEPADHTGPPLRPQDLAFASRCAAALRAGPDPGASAAPWARERRAGQGLPRALAGSPLTSRASSPGDHKAPGRDTTPSPTGGSDPVNQDTTASTVVTAHLVRCKSLTGHFI